MCVCVCVCVEGGKGVLKREEEIGKHTGLMTEKTPRQTKKTARGKEERKQRGGQPLAHLQGLSLLLQLSQALGGQRRVLQLLLQLLHLLPPLLHFLLQPFLLRLQLAQLGTTTPKHSSPHPNTHHHTQTLITTPKHSPPHPNTQYRTQTLTTTPKHSVPHPNTHYHPHSSPHPNTHYHTQALTTTPKHSSPHPNTHRHTKTLITGHLPTQTLTTTPKHSLQGTTTPTHHHYTQPPITPPKCSLQGTPQNTHPQNTHTTCYRKHSPPPPPPPPKKNTVTAGHAHTHTHNSHHHLFLFLLQLLPLCVQLVTQIGRRGCTGVGVSGSRPVSHLVQLVAQRRDLQQLLLHSLLQGLLLMDQLLTEQQSHRLCS